MYVFRVLETACHDSHTGVQECALTALRSMCMQEVLKKVNIAQILSNLVLYLIFFIMDTMDMQGSIC